eukprot:gnl/TRDRNA2_/TRDRNA2_170184_c0_seq1.p1 gnl/TRDRNA2_/TRDRNA2_170184_c0~~gnl/TRDRNA2_/TRDRNA2_170184_c0_seq1.p1  ORF type:complete len:339 (+),score=63.43 gnl/TRDRNA2_/TRDRNA2_170184_c0_seq1:84-1019(+)
MPGLVGPLRAATRYFNLKTNLAELKAVNRKRRQMTVEARKDLLDGEVDTTSVPAADLIPIHINGMTFHHSEDEPLFRNVFASVQQGSLVAIMGAHGCGKATLGQLLAGNIFPLEGSIFVPMHLRVLHVSLAPFLMDSSLYQNLTFGAPDAPASTVIGVLERLHAKEIVNDLRRELLELGMIEPTEDEKNRMQDEVKDSSKTDWQDAVSHTEKAKIHIARGLIMNPEVIVAHGPLHHFDGETSMKVLRVIKEHLVTRGLGMPPESIMRRRPRTCFFTVGKDHLEAARESDVTWFIDKESLQIVMKDPASLRT